LYFGKWVDTYQGLLGTALPDTFTTDFFLRTFSPFYAKLFDGIRHDSGDPKIWLEKVIGHFEKLGIDTKPKRVVFSDGINSLDKVKTIIKDVDGRMMASFGIGTWLTNDFEDIEPLNMVIKLVSAKKNAYEPQRFAIKLSDVIGKHNGDEATIQDYLKRISS